MKGVLELLLVPPTDRRFCKSSKTDQDYIYDSLSEDEQLQWSKEQVKTYKKGDAVKAVIGGYWHGPYVYGYVVHIGEHYVGFRQLGYESSGVVITARPNSTTGLCRVTSEEMDEAKEYFLKTQIK